MTGLLGVLMCIWIIAEFYLYAFTAGWSSAQSHRHESCRSAGNCVFYYKFSLQGQPVALCNRKKIKAVHICVTATGVRTQCDLCI